MRLEAVAKDGRKAVLNYAHEDLEVCVGIATAAFVVATLRGDVSAQTATYTQDQHGTQDHFQAAQTVVGRKQKRRQPSVCSARLSFAVICGLSSRQTHLPAPRRVVLLLSCALPRAVPCHARVANERCSAFLCWVGGDGGVDPAVGKLRCWVKKQVRPGVWFPEEAFDDEDKRGRLFNDATRGAFMWERQEQGATAVERAPL